MPWSQVDPVIKSKILPLSTLTIGQAGCLLCSMCNLANGDPLHVIKTPGMFADGGLLIVPTVATLLGMTYVGASTTAPHGWCIGRTDKYASLGFPTHFLCVNVDTNECIDPLNFPAKITNLTYNINQYRVFTGIKLASPVPPPAFESPSSSPTVPDWGSAAAAKAKAKGITTPIADTVGSLPLYALLSILDKYLS